MTSLLTHTPPPQERQSFRRRGTRLARPGVSLMAQGEPMIWLTGGALATCVAMIASLLFLVFWSGIPTFWPARLLQVRIEGGGTILGELVRSEKYRLSRQGLTALDPSVRASAERRIEGRDEAVVTRQWIRTGNFELSGEHFRWVYDFSVPSGGESWPEWATTVERLEWGRFYGTPLRFTIRHVRELSAEEQELKALVDFVESQRWRAPTEGVEAWNQADRSLQEELREERNRRTIEFLSRFADAEGKRCLAVLASGGTIPVAEPPSDEVVVAVSEVIESPDGAWQGYRQHHAAVRQRFQQRRELERHEIGAINARIERARLALRQQELAEEVAAIPLATEIHNQSLLIDGVRNAVQDAERAYDLARRKLPAGSPLAGWIAQCRDAIAREGEEQLAEPRRILAELQKQQQELPAPVRTAIDKFLVAQREAQGEAAEIQEQIEQLSGENDRFELTMVTADGQEKALRLGEIVRAYPANQLGLASRMAVYFDRWWEYLSEEPREANSEGGVLPAIWGTVVMTLVMSMLVVPFGVLAALYLREYARAGVVVSAIRIAISNLAGVPSIVFGVFGLGFFCYLVGAYLDGGAENAGLKPLAPRIWWLWLFGLGVVGLAAFATGAVAISGRRPGRYPRWRRAVGFASLALWLVTLTLAVVVIFRTPFFEGFFATSLPNPTLGKGGLIWASLTLSLLTLPVVIVATEEALSSVPNSLREGSFACGASKWQTIRRIVLPHAMPGIMTGMILAMARGAGEVAPLMLVGAVKLQPELPVDGEFPFLHLSRSFMHLGFHIFDLGFQSQNSEAAIPMVFTTTLLLITIIALMNLAAVWIRSRLRKRFGGGQF